MTVVQLLPGQNSLKVQYDNNSPVEFPYNDIRNVIASYGNIQINFKFGVNKQIPYSYVVKPTSADIRTLVTLLNSYISNGSKPRSGTVALVAGASQFITFTLPMPDTNYTVVCNSAIGGNFSLGSLQTDGFWLQNILAADILTYSATFNN